ncbi:MAG: hypothetical protein QXV06_01080 [Ignisphaera sp.]
MKRFIKLEGKTSKRLEFFEKELDNRDSTVGVLTDKKICINVSALIYIIKSCIWLKNKQVIDRVNLLYSKIKAQSRVFIIAKSFKGIHVGIPKS